MVVLPTKNLQWRPWEFARKHMLLCPNKHQQRRTYCPNTYCVHKPVSSQYIYRVAIRFFQQSSFPKWNFDKNPYRTVYWNFQNQSLLKEGFKNYVFNSNFKRPTLKLHKLIWACPIPFFCRCKYITKDEGQTFDFSLLMIKTLLKIKTQKLIFKSSLICFTSLTKKWKLS